MQNFGNNQFLGSSFYTNQLRNANPEVIFQTRVYVFDRIQTRVPGFDIWWVTCQWQTHKSCTINSYEVYSDTTQFNSCNWPSWTAYSQVSRVFVYDVTTYKLSQLAGSLRSLIGDSWVELCRYRHFTNSNATRRRVELSSVKLCRYKHPLSFTN